jgi:hypothetical protein
MTDQGDEMEKPGRKRLYPDVAMEVYYARLTATHSRLARRLGNGNLSEGIRMAIEHCEKCPDMRSEMEHKTKPA